MGRYLCVSVHHSQAVGALTVNMADDAGPNDDTAADRPTESEPSTGATTNDPPSSDGTTIQSTYAWSLDASCGECGAAVAVRWRDGEDLVCGACKSW